MSLKNQDQLPVTSCHSAGYLYLPVEIAARELDSKILIAHFAVLQGLEVIVGQKWLLQENLPYLPRGLWLYKTLTPADAQHMEAAKLYGNKIAAIDEEIPGLGENAGGLRWVARAALEACDRVFCLGGMHRQVLMNKFPDYTEKYLLKGNPRWDLLRPELRAYYREEAEQIRHDHGPFILINTNIGLMNSAKNTPDEVVNTLVRHGKINLDLAEDRTFIKDLRAFETSNLQSCLELLPKLSAAFPDHKLILRPHPTERPETYHDVLAAVTRAELATSSTAAPWIFAADAVVHTSCTTGTEAFALGVPAISYQKLNSPLLKNYSSNLLNFTARTAEDVIALLQHIFAKDRGADHYDEDKQKVFRTFFSAQDGAFASERIAAACAEILAAAPLKKTRACWRPVSGYRQKIKRTDYQFQLFPDYKLSEIRKRIEKISHILGHDRPTIAVAKCGDGQFHFYDAALRMPEKTPFQVAAYIKDRFAS